MRDEIPLFLGIEIGGTKIQMGIGPGDGTLTGLWRGDVDVARGPEGIRAQIHRAFPELLAETDLNLARIREIGIGFGGPVDDQTQTIIKSHQIAGWDRFPLAEWLSGILNLPATLANDADAAGLGEALFGAGKGFSPVFYITVGSGIGGGLIVNGEIYRGCGKGAAEIGHLRVTDCASNQSVLVEEKASGWAIQEKARKLLAEGRGVNSLLRMQKRGHQVTTKEVGNAAARGDRFSLELLNDARAILAQGICEVIALLCPRRIVIGGGVALMGEELFFEPLRKLVAERVFAPFQDCYEIVPASLGEAMVVHGALALARGQFEKRSRQVG